MKMKLLYAALVLSPAVFAQTADVKTSVKANEQAATVNASTSVNSSTAIQPKATVHQVSEAAIDAQAKTKVAAHKAKARVVTQADQTVTTAKQAAPNAKISAASGSSAAISAGKSNKLNAATSLDNTATFSPAAKTGKVNATTKAAVKSAAAVKPKPVTIKNRAAIDNSTLLKIK